MNLYKKDIYLLFLFLILAKEIYCVNNFASDSIFPKITINGKSLAQSESLPFDKPITLKITYNEFVKIEGIALVKIKDDMVQQYYKNDFNSNYFLKSTDTYHKADNIISGSQELDAIFNIQWKMSENDNNWILTASIPPLEPNTFYDIKILRRPYGSELEKYYDLFKYRYNDNIESYILQILKINKSQTPFEFINLMYKNYIEPDPETLRKYYYIDSLKNLFEQLPCDTVSINYPETKKEILNKIKLILARTQPNIFDKINNISPMLLETYFNYFNEIYIHNPDTTLQIKKIEIEQRFISAEKVYTDNNLDHKFKKLEEDLKKAKINEVKQKIYLKQEAIMTLKDNIDTNKKMISTLNRQKDELDKEIIVTYESSKIIRQRIIKLEKKIDSLRTEIYENSNTTDHKLKEIDTLEKETSKLNNNVKDRFKYISTLNNEISSSNGKIKIIKTKVDSLQDQIFQTEKDTDRLKNELKNISSGIKENSFINSDYEKDSEKELRNEINEIIQHKYWEKYKLGPPDFNFENYYLKKYYSLFEAIRANDTPSAKKIINDIMRIDNLDIEKLEEFYNQYGLEQIYTSIKSINENTKDEKTKQSKINQQKNKIFDIIKNKDFEVEGDYFSPNFLVGESLGATTNIFNLKTRADYFIRPDFGLVYYGFQNNFMGIVPYLGVQFELRYFDKNIPIGLIPNLTYWHRLSISIGITLSSLKKEGRRDDLFSGKSLIVGINYRPNSIFKFAAGLIVFNKEDPNPFLDKKSLTVTPFLGISLDREIAKIIDDLLGTSLIPK